MNWNEQETCVLGIRGIIESVFEDINEINIKLSKLMKITDLLETLLSKINEQCYETHRVCDVSYEEMYNIMRNIDKYMIENEPLAPPPEFKIEY